MAAKKVDIMELRQLLLLKEKGESNRSCEKILGIHRNTINHYARLFSASGLRYAELSSLDEKPLNELFPAVETLIKNGTKYFRGILRTHISKTFLTFEKWEEHAR